MDFPVRHRKAVLDLLSWDEARGPVDLEDTAGVRARAEAGAIEPEDAGILLDIFREKYSPPGATPASMHPLLAADAELGRWLEGAVSASARRTAALAVGAAAAMAMNADPTAAFAAAAVRGFPGYEQILGLEQLQSQALELSFRDPLSRYAALYRDSRKLQVQDAGLDVEVARVGRRDAPELAEMGSAGIMVGGHSFVVEDFFVDLGSAEREQFLTLVAIHEYGERIFNDHHQASRLELAMAMRMGVLEPYLQFLKGRYLLKFRDVVLHRLPDQAGEALEEEGIDSDAGNFSAEAPSVDAEAVAAAEAIIRRFRVPPQVVAAYAGVDREDKRVLKGRVKRWAKVVVALEQTQAFYRRALDDAANALEDVLARPGTTARDAMLAIRVGLFRSLGVWKEEADEGTLHIARLSAEVRDKLVVDLLRELQEAAAALFERHRVDEGRSAEILADPLFRLSRAELEELAKADARIWQALELDLRLIPEARDGAEAEGEARVASEQARIEAARTGAWRFAIRAGLQAKGQSRALARYAKGLKTSAELWQGLRQTMAGVVLAVRSSEHFLDVEDVARTLAERVRVALREDLAQGRAWTDPDAQREIIQAQIDAELPDLWVRWLRVQREEGTDVPQEALRSFLAVDLGAALAESSRRGADPWDADDLRLSRLSVLHAAAAGDAGRREDIEEAVRRIIPYIDLRMFGSSSEREGGDFVDRVMGVIASRLERGVISSEMACGLARTILNHRGALHVAPRPDVVLAMMPQGGEWTLGDFLQAGRAVFLDRFSSLASHPELRAEVAFAEDFWATERTRWLGEAGWILDFAHLFPEMLPALAPSLAGLTREALWDLFDFKGALVRGRAAMFPEVNSSIARIARNSEDLPNLEMLDRAFRLTDEIPEISAVANDPDGWRRAAALARIAIVRAALQWTTGRLLDAFRVHVDLFAARLRREMVGFFAERFGLDAGLVEERLPPFEVNVPALSASLRQIVSEGVEKKELSSIIRLLIKHDLDPSRAGSLGLVPMVQEWKRIGPMLARLPIPEAARAAGALQARMQEMVDAGFGGDGVELWPLSSYGDRKGIVARLDYAKAQGDWFQRIHDLDRSRVEFFGRIGDLSSDADHAALLESVADIAVHAMRLWEAGLDMPFPSPVRTSLISEARAAEALLGEAMRLSVISAVQRGASFWGPGEALTFLGQRVPQLPRPSDTWIRNVFAAEMASGLGLYKQPFLKTIRRVHALYRSSLDDPRYGGYDQLGYLTAAQRASPTGDEDKALADHWKFVISRLSENPDVARAQAELAKVIRDVEAKHEEILARRTSSLPGVGEVLWEARVAWAIAAIRSGSYAGGKGDLQANLAGVSSGVRRFSAGVFWRVLKRNGGGRATDLETLLSERQRGGSGGGAAGGGGSPTPTSSPGGAPVTMAGIAAVGGIVVMSDDVAERAVDQMAAGGEGFGLGAPAHMPAMNAMAMPVASVFPVIAVPLAPAVAPL